MFSVNRELIKEIHAAMKGDEDMDRFKGKSTLKLIQSISTIPSAFPKKLNTCGRICMHDSGRFVIVSNRGHQSIAVLRVNQRDGLLSTVGLFHTRGETPRHFKFDKSGQYLIVANQDSDNISVFNFNTSSGEIKFTGNEYHAPSPNFICCCSTEGDESLRKNVQFGDHVQVVPVDKSRNFAFASEADELRHELAKAREEILNLKNEINNVKLVNQ